MVGWGTRHLAEPHAGEGQRRRQALRRSRSRLRNRSMGTWSPAARRFRPKVQTCRSECDANGYCSRKVARCRQAPNLLPLALTPLQFSNETGRKASGGQCPQNAHHLRDRAVRQSSMEENMM